MTLASNDSPESTPVRDVFAIPGTSNSEILQIHGGAAVDTFARLSEQSGTIVATIPPHPPAPRDHAGNTGKRRTDKAVLSDGHDRHAESPMHCRLSELLPRSLGDKQHHTARQQRDCTNRCSRVDLGSRGTRYAKAIDPKAHHIISPAQSCDNRRTQIKQHSVIDRMDVLFRVTRQGKLMLTKWDRLVFISHLHGTEKCKFHKVDTVNLSGGIVDTR